MNTLVLGTNLGNVEIKWLDNGMGKIDDEAVTAFSWGHCHSFAYEMHDLTGWPIIGLGSRNINDPMDQPGHFVVYDPRLDDFVDIQGGRALERYGFLTSRGIREFPPTQLPKLYRPIRKDIARPFVETVLSKLALLPDTGGHKKWKKYMGFPFEHRAKMLDIQ